ncbi:Hypothetical_protein [Hexamita inflata]|uniref:Hypothetical_protein n=1 Tax=Hexamita inflata TaxID=28002 RepID=A0AA86R7X1_9EUKA|nr:Hypothetical protein HINF_LOCUS57853 [Hexamita inflata]
MITLQIIVVVQQLFNQVNKIKKLYQHLLITYIIQFIEIYKQTSRSSKYIPNDSCRIVITCQLPATSCSCMNDFYLLAVSTILQNLHDQCVFLLKREPQSYKVQNQKQLINTKKIQNVIITYNPLLQFRYRHLYFNKSKVSISEDFGCLQVKGCLNSRQCSYF